MRQNHYVALEGKISLWPVQCVLGRKLTRELQQHTKNKVGHQAAPNVSIGCFQAEKNYGRVVHSEFPVEAFCKAFIRSNRSLAQPIAVNHGVAVICNYNTG